MRWKPACGVISAAILLAGCGQKAVSTPITPGGAPGGTGGPPIASPSPGPFPSATAVTIPSPLVPSASPLAPVKSSPAATHSPSPAPSPTPVASPASVIQQSDSGKTVTLRLGASAQLQLPESMHWSAPQVAGSAVTVTPVTFIRDPGYLAWTVRAVAAGEATITSAGSPICPPGVACPMFVVEFRVTILVSPA